MMTKDPNISSSRERNACMPDNSPSYIPSRNLQTFLKMTAERTLPIRQ